MPKPTGNSALLLVLLASGLALETLALDAGAQTGGLPIVEGPGPRELGALVPDGNGGATMIYFEGDRVFRSDLLAGGAVAHRWPGGVVYSTSPAPYSPPVARRGRADDWFLAWNSDSIRVQRLDAATGAREPGWPAAGRALCAEIKGFVGFYGVDCGVDGSNVAQLVWDANFDTGNQTMHASIDATGAIVEACALTSCGDGNNRSGSVVVSGDHVVSAEQAFGFAGGEPAEEAIVRFSPGHVGHRPFESSFPGLCLRPGAATSGACAAPTGDGDAVLGFSGPAGWNASRMTRGPGSFFGGEVWPAAVPILPGVGGYLAEGVSDGQGGVFFVQRDFAPPYALKVVRLAGDGSYPPGWTASGVIATSFANLTYGTGGAVDDGAGGAFLVWQQYSGLDHSIHAQHVLGNGTIHPSWPANGLVVATMPGTKGIPQLARDGSDGIYVVWRDHRVAQRPDLYAQHITGGGTFLPVVGVEPEPSPVAFALSRGAPNPTRGAVSFTLTLPEDAHVTARVLDVAGRVVARVANAPMPAGAHALRWNGNGEDGNAAPAGIYLFDVRGGGRVVHSRVVRL